MGYRSMKRFFNALTLNLIFILSIQASLLKDLPEIKYESFKLDNGLTVIVHEDKKSSNGCCQCLVPRWFEK